MANKEIILDVSVIIDLWIGENAFEMTEQLIDTAVSQKHGMWIAASSLATLDYVGRQALKRKGKPTARIPGMVAGLIENLLSFVRVLSCHGFEQQEIHACAHDFEDAQIAACARSLTGADICIVTEDKKFDTLGEISALTPSEALAWLEDDGFDAESAIPFIDLKTQQRAIRPTLEKNIEQVLRHGRYIMGPEIEELETRLAEYVGVNHCITVSSGTDSLLIALMALGIGPGDEVITTPFTFIATGEMIALLGAKPVFVDIDPRTCNIDPAKIEPAITEKTRAIIPVSLYGQCADFDQINAIVETHNATRKTKNQKRITVVEDAAQSFGATYKTRPSCALSTIASTSFFPSKPLGGYGDGGALFTDDDDLATAMREIRVHGQDRRYHHPRVGVNGRMDALQAAVVLAKMERFEEEVKARQKVAARYQELLTKVCPDLLIPFVKDHNTSVYAQYTVQTENRDELVEQIKQAGVPIAVHYPVPLHLQPAFAGYGYNEGDLPVAEAVAKKVFSLPMGPDLSEEIQGKIVSILAAQLPVI